MPDLGQSAALPPAIQDALATGATVLAPNERAAADLSSRYDQAQIAAGLHAWEPARVHSWNIWLGTLWSSLIAAGAESRLLLNPAQEHMLWREVIAADPAGQPLSSADTLADLAHSAFRLAAAYDALPDLRRPQNTHDARTFAAWATGFTRRCHQRQLLSSAELPAALGAHIAAGTLGPPSTLLLAGFDDDTPARASLLETLFEHGCAITRLDIGSPILSGFIARGDASSEAPPFPDNPPQNLRFIVRASDPQVELSTAAHWIRRFIEQRPSPLPRVALIVPTLGKERAQIDSTLRNILAPELQSIDADLSSAPFAFATGTPLADTSMITAALELLRWSIGALPLDRISALLLSPYIGASASLPERAAFDAFQLRDTPLLRPEITLARCLAIASNHPHIAAILAPVAARLSRLSPNERRSFAEWMEFLRDLLRDASFPGDRPLTATEFHQARAWDRVLDTVATLDFAGIRVDLQTALAAVEREARQAHTSSDPYAAVQIMAPSEAAGSSFDAVVFLRATDAHWPLPERPNPLLGWALQHDRRMPGTDPAQTSARAEQATARLVASASSTLFFYAAEDESGPQRLSPTVEHLGWSQISAADLITPAPAFNIAIEEVEDTAPLPPLLSAQVIGGARVLKQQATCGFLAFAELRLRSKPIDEVAAGLDALESGNLLHRTMQAFWSEVRSQDELRRMAPADREALLVRCIDQAVHRGLSSETPWDAAYIQLQKDRLLILLRFWLDAELERGPFTVLALEEKTEVTVGPLTLSVRVDRIDRVAAEPGEEDGFVYVDYKTGYSASPANWAGERPEDPQLPLYALLSEPGELKGLVFARIRPGKGMAWAGYQAEPGILPQKRPVTLDLDLMIDEWRHNLSMLAEDFASGRATVSPRDFASDCARCAQRLLCRVDPETLLLNLDDPTGDEAE